MRFSIVTPSFRQSEFLRLCVASVADQEISHEHIIQDAGSDDATLEWLARDARVKAFVEKDGGMYDAVNRGLRRAQGEFLGYLNCDEQYLPGALQKAAEFFDANPGVDVLFGDVIMVNNAGAYLCHRKMQTPLLYHTWTTQLSTLTCATFFRRSVIERGYFFNAQWRSGGDGEWMVRLLRGNIPMATLGEFTSVFAKTGANLSSGDVGRREALKLRRTAPLWSRILRPLLILHHRFRRFSGGMYRQKPFQFSIYLPGRPDLRVTQQVKTPLARSPVEEA